MAAAATAVSSEHVLAGAAAGDSCTALVSALHTHVEGVYDFALRMARDRDTAERIVEAAFCRMDPTGYTENLPASLYSSARICGLAELRSLRGRRSSPDREREGFVFTRVNGDRLSDPTAGFDRELAELVWNSAAAFATEEYSLLDLHLRRELAPLDLATQPDLNGSAELKLTRLRGALEEAVTSALFLTRWRRNCIRLDVELSGITSTPDSELRRIVRGHLRQCEQCAESANRAVPATELFAALAPVSTSPGLRKLLLERVLRATGLGGPRGRRFRLTRRSR